MAITALEKPKGQWCSHCTPGRGCQIYLSKPAECAAFSCVWLQDDRLGPEWKPDKSKIVLVYDGSQNQLVAHIDSNFGVWQTEPYLGWLREMSAAGRPHGGTVLVVERGKTTLIFPERAIDLGVLQADDRIMISVTQGADGRERYGAQVMHRSEAEKIAADLQAKGTLGVL